MRPLVIAAALTLTLASTAGAQTALDLTPGAARARPATASRAPEFFRFVGEPGQTVRLTVTAPGAIEGQLFEPQGAQMLTAGGEGKMTLEAILPADGVYLFSVVRAVPSNPYNVALAVQTADPHFAYFTESIGYTVNEGSPSATSTTCWVEPGAKIRVTYPGGITTVVTLGRGSKRYYHQAAPDGRSMDFESDTAFDGDEAVTTYRGMSQGEVVQRLKVLERHGTWTYSGYACPPGPTETARPNSAIAPAPAPAPKPPAAAVADRTQRLTVDPAQATSFAKPLSIRAGELIASDISDTDYSVGPDWRAEQFTFSGRAGEVITAQVRSDIPTLEVIIRDNNRTGKALVEGPARTEPLRLTLPKDGEYFLIVHAKGPQRIGKYVLSLGSGGNAPALQPASLAQPPSAPTPPAIPGVLNIIQGQTTARPAAGADGAVEMFQILAGFGTKLHAAAKGSGPLAMRLFTPEGAEMLAVEGAGTATLDAYLPRDGIYFVTVARRNAYTLTVSAEEPALPDALFALNVGYEIKNPQGQLVYNCWVEPGRKMRTLNPSLKVDLVGVHPGPGKIRFEGMTQGKPVTLNVARHMEGDVLVYESDAPTTMRTPVDKLALLTGGTWKGYLCPASPAQPPAGGPAPAQASAAPAQVPRLIVGPERRSSLRLPIPARPGELIVGDISDKDTAVGPGRSDQFAFTGRAGEVITAQLRSDVPTLQVMIYADGAHKALLDGSPMGAPARLVLPKDGSYYLLVYTSKAKHTGKYQLSFGSGGTAPPFDSPDSP